MAYVRGDWPHWVDDDGDCQDARDEVLIVESTVTATLSSDRCAVVAGRWIDAYTGAVITDPSAIDIDHMVPLANAHRSGAARWSTTMKRSYANDLQLDVALIAVSASVNRSKGDRSPDQWRPPAATAWCGYATWWIEVKYRWSLTVTPAERTALQDMLRTC